MQEGTLNELVLSKVPSFIKKHGKFEITDIKEYGLLGSNDSWFAVYSPGGIAVIKHDNWVVDVLDLAIGDQLRNSAVFWQKILPCWI